MKRHTTRALATSAAILSLLASAPAHAQGRRPVLLQSQPGALPAGMFGAKVGILGDIDGDGVSEWMAGRAGPPSGPERPELRVHSGASGKLLYTLEGLGRINSLFLQSLIDLGDVDGDGVTDFAYANANARMGQDANVGAAVVYSGATGHEIYTRWGLMVFGGFGASMAALGDVNGDHVPDFVVGAIGTLNENAWVVSGATGEIVFGVRGPTGLGDIEFGWSAAAIGDVDGDGCADFAIGTRSGGLVDGYSSRNGRRLFRVRGGDTFGRSLAGIGDVNGDGRADLLVGEKGTRSAHILCGRSGALLKTVTAPDGGNFGSSLASAGDVNRDGVEDFLVAGPRARELRGLVQLFSGRTGRLLLEIVGAQPGDMLGQGMAGGADLNADGWPDLVLGAPGADPLSQDDGEVTAWSGALRR